MKIGLEPILATHRRGLAQAGPAVGATGEKMHRQPFDHDLYEDQVRSTVVSTVGRRAPSEGANIARRRWGR